MTTQRELIDRYPYMFSGKNLGFSIPNGWMSIFERLCEDIDALLGQDKQGFHFVQCKEKFGSARWYWDTAKIKNPARVDIIREDGSFASFGGPDLTKAPNTLGESIGHLVGQAEAKTEHACIVCGAPSLADQHEHWILQVCPEHKKMRRSQGGLPRFWPNEDER